MAVVRSMEIEMSVTDQASSDITSIDQSVDSLADSVEDTSGGVTGLAGRLGDLGGRMQSVGTQMTKYLTGPIVAASGAMWGLATQTGRFADDLLDLEAATGINTDTLQEFRAAEVSAGVEADSLARGIMRMNRQMQESGEYSARVTSAAEEYGVALKNTTGGLRGAEGVTMDLMKAIAEIEDPQERARAGSEAFGRDWERIAPIVALGTEELERMSEAEVISPEQLEAADEFRRSWDELKREFTLVAMTIGAELAPMLQEHLMPILRDTLMPALERVGEAVGDLLQWFGNLDPGWQRVIIGAVGLAAALGPVIAFVGTLLALLPAVVAGAKVVGGAFLALTGPVGWIIGLVAALVAGIIYLWRTNAEFRNAIMAIWEGIRSFVAFAIEAIQVTIGVVMALIRGDWQEAWSLIRDWAIQTWEIIREFLAAAWEWLVSAAQAAWQRFVDTIRERVIAAYETVKEWIGKAIDWIRELPSKMVTAGRDLIQGLIDGIKQRAGAVVDAMQQLANDMLGGFLDWFDFGSPSRLMMEYGELLGEGLTIGVEREERRVHEVWPKYAPGEGLSRGAAPAGGGVFSPAVTINVNGSGGDPNEVARAIDRRLRLAFDEYMNRYLSKQRRRRG